LFFVICWTYWIQSYLSSCSSTL